MKTIHLTIAALAFVAATAAQAVEATRIEAPVSWSNSRAEVQREAHRAVRADELDHGEAGFRFADPSSTRKHARIPATTMRVSVDQRGHGAHNLAGDFATGGM